MRKPSLIPSWEEAKVYGNQEFIVKSNIPKEYLDQVVAFILRIIKQEKEMLTQIFGYAPEKHVAMKVFIVSRVEDYEKMFLEMKIKQPVIPSSLYDYSTKQMAIFFAEFRGRNT